MKGDVFKVGDTVLVTGHGFVGAFGKISHLMPKHPDDCQPYLVKCGGGTSVITCCCYLTRSEPPELAKDWSAKSCWKDGPWVPHLGALPKQTMDKLLEQIKAARKRRNEKK